MHTTNLITIEKKLALFKCKPNQKIPDTRHGYLDAKKGVSIKELTQHHNNVAIACITSGIFVLDLDVDETRGLNGIKTILKFEEELGKLPLTLTQSTPRGGIHLIFSDEGIINPIGKIGKDCDTRWRGYILCEPSTINGKPYKFTKGIDENGDFKISKLPQKWLDFINKPKPEIQISQDKNNNYLVKREIIDGNFKKMYDNCSFIKHCVECAKSLSEPEWHLFACVLNSLSNGEKLFDLYSRPHPDYNPVLVKKKFQNAKKYNVNCNTICGISSCCKNCNHRKEN